MRKTLMIFLALVLVCGCGAALAGAGGGGPPRGRRGCGGRELQRLSKCEVLKI